MSITSGLNLLSNFLPGVAAVKGAKSAYDVFADPEGTKEKLQAFDDNLNLRDESSAYEFLEDVSPGLGTSIREMDPLIDKQMIKDYVFDYTDPSEYGLLPLLFAGPLGVAASRGIKAGKVANKARKRTGPGGADYKPGGIEKFLQSKTLRYGGPGAAIIGPLAADEEFRDDIKTIAGFEDDALDQSNEDLKKVNEEEQKVADAEDMDDPSEEEEEKGLEGLQDKLAVFQKMMAPGEMTGGYTIASSGVDTPEIRRYAGGGIADLEPMMMADGGIAKFFGGGILKIAREAIKRGTKKFTDKGKKKKETKKKEEKGVTKDKKTKTQKTKEEVLRAIPPEVKTLVGVPIGASIKLSKEALKKAGGEGGMGRGAARLIGYPAIGYGAYDYLTDDEEKKPPPSTKAAEVKLPEPDTMKDILYQNSLERATAAGRTEPSFMDYLASFPGSYTEKVGKDPEFAKQMMAGFMAMMKPTEGFVPRNALVDFGEAAYAEQARQQDAVPDQLQLIERLRDDPDLLKAFRQINQDAPDPVTDQKLIGSLKETLLSNLYGVGNYDEESEIIDKTTNKKITDIELLQRYRDSGGNYTEMLKTLTAKAD